MATNPPLIKPLKPTGVAAILTCSRIWTISEPVSGHPFRRSMVLLFSKIIRAQLSIRPCSVGCLSTPSLSSQPCRFKFSITASSNRDSSVKIMGAHPFSKEMASQTADPPKITRFYSSRIQWQQPPNRCTLPPFTSVGRPKSKEVDQCLTLHTIRPCFAITTPTG